MPYKNLKNIFIKLPLLKSVAYYLTRRIPRVLMYHRFAHDGLNMGIAKEAFEWQLNEIKKNFHAMSLSEYIEKKDNGCNSKPVVIITVDDAYYDFYTAAYPLLLKYNIPATLFISTDFVGKKWFWWDKIKYIIIKTNKADITCSYNSKKFAINTTSIDNKIAGWHLLSDYCMNLSEDEKVEFISTIAASMNVDVPVLPVEEYKQMTWDEIIEVSKNRIEIGAHTVSHPILTHMDREQLKKEVEISKSVIEKKTGLAVKTFCYPNGRPSDYNQNVVNAVKEAGYLAAVVANDGGYDLNERYTIPRFGVSDNKIDFLWKLYSMELSNDKIVNMKRLYFPKLIKAIKNPFRTILFVRTFFKSFWYKVKYEKILKKATFGKRLRISGKLIIKGHGKVFFGDDVVCSMTVTPFTHSPEAVIKIGDGAFLNGTRFGAAKSISIGSKCILADCRIMDTDFHSLRKDRHSKYAPVEVSPVYIGDNVWIGAQAAVLKGVTIGENSVIGFGAVVTKDIEPNVIAAGNPAKVVREIPM